MALDPAILEKEAYSFLSQNDFEEAFRLFKRAAEGYKRAGNHKQAALCFTSAASCWNKRSEERTSYNAAVSYEKAAEEAEKELDLESAYSLYKYAALNYERDGEYFKYSHCFYRSKESHRNFLGYRIFRPDRLSCIGEIDDTVRVNSLWKRLFIWLALSLSFLIWGHGERPVRTFLTGLFVIILSAFLYTFGHIVRDSVMLSPGFNESLYFSVITFTTVGYGDLVPVGMAKIVSMLEAFSGVFIMPLFIIGMARKYLRM